MTEIPDAPWIRDAELNGVPDGDTWHCPVCGVECPETYYLVNGDVVGCECCVYTEEAAWWEEKHGNLQ